jgi:PAS domain S-box-containing protein
MVKQITRESPGQLGGFEEIAQIGSFEIDLVDRSWSASRNFCYMFGLKYSENLPFQELKTFIHPDYYNSAIKNFEDCIKSGEKQTFESICFDNDKKPIFTECRVRLICDAQGYPIYLQGTLQDISDRKANEAQLNDLRKMNKIKDEMLTIVAHDLKSPINQIGAILNLLKMNGADSFNEFFKYIEDACGVASNIINDLIELAELKEPGYALQKALIDINDLVKGAAVHHEHRAKEKNISIDCKLCEVAMALVQPLKISRVLDNLLSNAIKFTPVGGLINISTETRKGEIIIKITDSGIGIHPDNLPFIFERFSTARQPGTKGERSTGLGLSIVKNIMDLHKGHISVKSQVGKGSQFVVALPVTQ